MENKKQLKPKSERTFWDWVEIKNILQKFFKPNALLSVPKYILVLPCGCTRKASDPYFKIQKNGLRDFLHFRGWSDNVTHCPLINEEPQQEGEITTELQEESKIGKGAYFVPSLL